MAQPFLAIANLRTGPCRSCGAPMVWAQTMGPKGRPIPLDPEPVADGNLGAVMIRATEHGMTPFVAYIKKTDVREGPRYVTHFATCPNRDQHRKGKS